MSLVLHYTIEGEGEPVVLLHGFLASSHYFTQLRKRLAKTHTVISLDLLGFGKSPKPKGDYTYSELVAAVHETLAHLGVSQFVLVGHSLGALIALRYSLVFPGQVRRLGLLNPPMYKSAEQALDTLKGTGLHYRVMMHSPARDLMWYGAKMLPRFPFNKRRPAINLTDVLRSPGHARKQVYQHIILRGEFFDDIAQVITPTLLVLGKRDRPRYHQNSRGWLPPSGITAISVTSGHHFPVMQPEKAAQILHSVLLDD